MLSGFYIVIIDKLSLQTRLQFCVTMEKCPVLGQEAVYPPAVSGVVMKTVCNWLLYSQRSQRGIVSDVFADTVGDLLITLHPVVVVEKEAVRADKVDEDSVVHNVVAILVFGPGAGVHSVVPPCVLHLLDRPRQPNQPGMEVFNVPGKRRLIVPLWVYSDKKGLHRRQRGVAVQSHHDSA